MGPVSIEPFGPVEMLSGNQELDEFNSGVAELDQWLRRCARVAAGAGTAATYACAEVDGWPASTRWR